MHGGSSLQAEHSKLTQRVLQSRWTEDWKKLGLASSFQLEMDRIRVLGPGDDGGIGHTGCVNALSWAEDGQLLLSGGDDTTVRLWRMDTSNSEEEYPFVCQAVLQTGHRGNIFNAHMLPFSTRIATVAGDSHVRVFDVGQGVPTSIIAGEAHYKRKDASIALLKCHTSRTKRIITEQSPDLFLSVAEDGRVRQHDLRVPHTCRSSCPAPLVKVNHELATLALSPLTPYQFVVAGDSPYGYLFDRRHAGRFLKEEWGEMPTASESDLATCVRRFGRMPSAEHRKRHSDHITGAKISSYNGHEVLLSYSGDAAYLFSTKDDPTDHSQLRATGILQSNRQAKKKSETLYLTTAGALVDDEDDESSSNSDTDEDEDEESQDDTQLYRAGVPFITPTRRYNGACNVETVKDVNFIGPYDEYVVSGSDDGNFFVWQKATGKLHGIYEGDGSVVNVVEAHPHLPLIAVSGIDHSIKLFAPTLDTSDFSRMDDAENIVKANERKSATRYNVTHILLSHLLNAASAELEGQDGDDLRSQCEHQ